MSIVRPDLRYGRMLFAPARLMLSGCLEEETKAVPEVTALHTTQAEVDEVSVVCLGVFGDV